MVVQSFPQLSETFLVNKFVGLADRGVDVHAVCRSSPEASWAAFEHNKALHALRDRVHVTPSAGVTASSASAMARSITALGRDFTSTRRYIWPEYNDAARLRDVLLDGPLIALQPQVVHFEFGVLAAHRMDLRDRLDAAVTVSFRGFDINFAGLDEPGFYNDVWSQTDRIHVLGRDLWNRALRRGATDEVPHSYIPPAIHLESTDFTMPRPGTLGTESNPLRILSIGRLTWQKGYDYALEAVAQLVQSGVSVEYRIIGSGELRPAAAYWRHHYGLDDHVELLGGLSQPQVGENLRWADVLLHAATSEGFCNAVIEAQAHQVPVVCSDAGGLAENVEHGVTGTVVARRDSRALADAMRELATDGSLRSRLGLASRRRVQNHFAMKTHLDAWVDFYDTALVHRHKR